MEKVEGCSCYDTGVLLVCARDLTCCETDVNVSGDARKQGSGIKSMYHVQSNHINSRKWRGTALCYLLAIGSSQKELSYLRFM